MTCCSPPLTRTVGWALTACALSVPVSVAQTSGADERDAVLTLGKVQAQGAKRGALPARKVLSSVDVIGADQVQDQHVDNSWELFAKVPGMQLTPFRMGTEAGRFSFRGFNGEGRINAVKLLIDGIPSNDNAGAMPYLDSVMSGDIAAIEVVRGTNDARYGLNAIAGDVNLVTRVGGDAGHLSVTAGSFGTREVQLSKGFESGPWTQNYFLGWRDSEGYRDHAEAIKRNFAGKWGFNAPEGDWSALLSTRYYHNQAQEPGYFPTYLQARAAPRDAVAYAAADAGERQTVQTALHLDGLIGSDWTWSGKAYVNRYTNARYVRFSQAGSQQERDNDETQRGAIATATWTPSRVLAVETGVDAQWQDNTARRWRTAARQRLARTRDWDYTLQTHGAYVQAVLQPLEGLQLVPAYRIDRVDGHLDDRLTGRRYDAYGYGTIRQPKLSASYALGAAWTAYANWGRSFQIGAGDGAYRTTVHDLGPSINTGWEAGLKFVPAAWLSGRVAYWEQRADGEVATVLGAIGTGSDVVNVGRTFRRGWDAQVNLQPDARWNAWLAYSRQRATVARAAPGALQTEGRDIENVPHWLASAGVDWQVSDRLRLSAWGNGQGDYHLERTNTLGRYGGYALANLGASWTLDARNEVSLQLKNLTDRFYVYAWYDSGLYGFSPGDGRGLYASWNWSF